MASTYKTPGVYVEEISKFPPSVAQVETAVPAFIGYTEFAMKNGEDLTNAPTKIFSLTEFEIYFGKGDPDVAFNTYLDSNDRVTSVVATVTFYLYESLRMFFANGGGKCYIISVGNYETAVPSDITPITKALAELEKMDEPTIISAPDAVLAGTGLYDFQQQALAQCNKLQDRVLICDLLASNESVAGETLQDRVNEFREKVGINYLKYGAAYTPYINSTLSRDVRFRNVILRRGTISSNTLMTFSSLSSDNNLLQLVNDMSNAKKAVDDLVAVVSTTAPAGILTLASGNLTFEDEFKDLYDAYSGAQNLANLQAIFLFSIKILAKIKDFRDALPTVVATTPTPASTTNTKSFILKTDIDNMVTSSGIKTVFETLAKHSNGMSSKTGATDKWFTENPATATTNLAKTIALVGLTTASYNALSDATIAAKYAAVPAGLAANLAAGFSAISANYSSFSNFFYSVQNAGDNYEKIFHNSLYASFGTYKSVIDKVKSSVNALPPSATIAGIYAMVDGNRGVWKAPANVSLSSVSGPVTAISNAIQDDLNVDTTAGKSINAIRSFTGKGTLVWGARTLAGNDNEWRYVSVRRFYNMVEESVKKASSQFVFEPNDANTWVKVKAMIENFLTLMWRQGALAGAKPEHAFFVKIGLGETMTADDILNGFMNVEIGMAVVRPAEFIILKFSHKMQES